MKQIFPKKGIFVRADILRPSFLRDFFAVVNTIRYSGPNLIFRYLTSSDLHFCVIFFAVVNKIRPYSMERRYCLMYKLNSFHNRLYVLFSFGYALFSFGYASFTFRYVIISFGYAPFSFGYVFFSFG